eukprot:NODE_1199_length_1428_cov_131.184473_g1188_i0.p2 GENE.NODE_1199_length_1428_cov_131.184473_g1188_i0~~NODE_1199_length_1428_cov_131.184473_g1188_i0.p2  ORF type:complete len:464 (+),score=138.12 NODE_1199_length_1428_cov_131.184473_g1188_i0:181-1392(+)
MQGSNGMEVQGLHHGEESLPEFVKARGNNFAGPASGRKLQGIVPPPALRGGATDCQWCDQVDFDPATGGKFAVTQKLETPVLYFYSPAEVDVQVDVEFPKGLVTEVYPSMSAFGPAFQKVDGVANGTAQWKVHVHAPENRVEVPSVEAGNIWEPSRRVSANMVTNMETKESEHHIFYRGVGQFHSEVRVETTETELSAFNTRHETVPAAFLLESDGKTGYIRALGAIPGRQAVVVPIAGEHLTDTKLPMDLFQTRCVVLLESALMAAGLFPLEARAMVDTWTRSYFQSPGMRVLYVAPREWTDALLPIKVNPAPVGGLERVLVGRVEVMPAAQEARMVAALKAGAPTVTKYSDVEELLNTKVDMPALHRFSEAKLRRAVALAGITDAKLLAWIDEYIVLELTV